MRLVQGFVSRSFVCIVLLPLSIWLSCYWYKVHAVYVHYEFSFPLCTQTTQAITDVLAQPGNRLKQAQQLLDEYPIIKDITLEYGPQGAMCMIECQEPMFVVNNSVVVLSNYAIVHPELFELKLLDDMSHVTIHEPIGDMVWPSLYNCITQRSDLVKEQFTLIWHHDWHVMYTDVINVGYGLLARADQEINAQVLKLYHAIIAHHKNVLKKKIHGGPWMVDIRFDNQIILCAQKGGQGYGKINAR